MQTFFLPFLQLPSALEKLSHAGGYKPEQARRPIPIFENFDLQLPGDGFVFLRCCIHEFRIFFQLMRSGLWKTARLP